jgi:hypothetical protein
LTSKACLSKSGILKKLRPCFFFIFFGYQEAFPKTESFGNGNLSNIILRIFVSGFERGFRGTSGNPGWVSRDNGQN